MTVDLSGKVAVVTGAAGGLGQAYTAALADAGVTVVCVDRDEAVLDLDGAKVAIVADVARLDEVTELADRVLAELGGVDIVVNNAAQWRPTPLDAPRDQALADFDALFAVNTAGPFLVQRALVGSMIERGGGDIVNVTTSDVLPPDADDPTNPPTTDLAIASKWALNGFTVAWALALRDRRVRVNAIAVGPTDTPLGREMYESASAWATPEDQAALLLELLGEGPDGRTGETIGARPGAPLSLPPRRARGEDIV